MDSVVNLDTIDFEQIKFHFLHVMWVFVCIPLIPEIYKYYSRDTVLKNVNISVFVIGDREYRLALFPMQENRQYPGLINGTSGAKFAASKINPLLQGKEYYILRKSQ